VNTGKPVMDGHFKTGHTEVVARELTALRSKLASKAMSDVLSDD